MKSAMQLKATNTDATNHAALKLTQLDLTYTGTTDANKAFRVAIFVEDLTDEHTNPVGGVGELITILTMENAHTFSYSASPAVPEKAVSDEDTLSEFALNTVNKAATLAEVAANTTNFYKVVVRIWLEGEDTTCKNDTFASLNLNWSLDLAFELGTTTTAVYNINMKTTE